MLNIRDQVYVTLKIDGSPVEYANIKDITLCEGNGAFAPTMKIELDDPTSELSKSHALTEGNPVEILFTRRVGDTQVKPRKYRIFGPTRDNNSNNPNVSIIGILDAPLYFTASARDSYIGTTDSVLSSVAKKCGLKFIGPSNGRKMNDSQTWLNVTTTRAAFVNDVTRHAFMDANSGMDSVVTSFHELKFKNLIDEINTPVDKIKWVFTHSAYDSTNDAKSKKVYIVKEARDRSSAGVMSNWANYGSTRCSNHIEGVPKKATSVDVKSPGPYLAINKEVTDMVKRTRFDYARLDCSNTHCQYQNALYQNRKLLALFSETMSLLVTDLTDVQLFDVILYRQADADPKTKVRNEDRYIVVGKTIVMRGGIHYAERIQCSRISVTMKGGSNLMASLGASEGPRSRLCGGTPDKSPLLAEPTISQGSLGMVAQNMPAISSVASSVSQLGATSTNVASFAPALGSTVSSVTGPVSNLSSMSNGTGSVSDMLGQVTAVTGPMVAVGGQLTSLKGAVQSSPAALTGMLGSMGSQYFNGQVGAPLSFVSSALMNKNSSLGILTNLLPLLGTYGMLNSTAGSVLSSLPAAVQLTGAFSSLSGQHGANTGTLLGLAGVASNLWNSTLSGITGMAIPQVLPDNLGFMSSVMQQVSYLKGANFSQMMPFVSSSMNQVVGGNPNWMSVNSMMYSTTSIARDIESLKYIGQNF